MRLEVMSMTVTSRLQASAGQRVPSAARGCAVINVPGAVRLPRIEDAHRNVAFDGRKDRARMQHLGAEVGQLGGLGERELRHQARRGDDARVGAQHAVHVGPDLNLARADAGADERTRIIRAAAPQRRRMPIGGRADKSAEDRHRARRRESASPIARSAALVSRLSGVGARVVVVGDDGATRIDPVGRARRPAVSAAATRRELRSSPIAATTSSVRGETSRSTASARTMPAS